MKDILFTIDDGPSPDTKRLVDFLASKKIPTIMFFIGEKMEQHPDEVDYVIQSGVLIGNHTYNHPAMSTLSLEDAIQQIKQTEEIINAAYQRNAQTRAHKVLRFPYLDLGGDNRSKIMQYLTSNGFEQVQTEFVRYGWFDQYRTEPHISASFHCFDWELWLHPETFGIPELLNELHSPGEADRGSIFNGESGELIVIHDVGWKTTKDERHYESIVEELEKAEIRYLEPVFLKLPKVEMHNHAPKDYVCPFCLLIQGIENKDVLSVQNDVIYRDNWTTAFVSSHQWPNNHGNVIVIPNQHHENIFDLPLSYAPKIHRVAKHLAFAMKTAYACDGISTRQHNEPAGNQDVWHYHLHITPRYQNDNFYTTQRALMPAEKRAKHAETLRTALAELLASQKDET